MLAATDRFETDLAALAEQAKALSHPARVKILQVLAERSECICGEIVDDLPLAQATVSRHLKKLKEAGLVQGTIDGPSVCYCLDTEALRKLESRFASFFEGLDLESASGGCC